MDNLRQKYIEALRPYPFDTEEEALGQGVEDYTLAERDTFTALDTPYTMRLVTRKRTHSEKKTTEYVEESSSSGESTDDTPFYDDLHLTLDLFVKGTQIIDSCELKIQRNQKYGLVGRNGIGKTTLIKAIRKRKFGIPKGLTIHAIRQDYVSDEKVLGYVGGENTGTIQKKQNSNTIDEAIGKNSKHSNDSSNSLNKFSESIGNNFVESSRTSKKQSYDYFKDPKLTLRELGFTAEQMEMPLRSLSGGWRMRAQLARAIYLDPDLVLLDEPTNFLDLKAIAYLEKQVQNMKTVIVVSHDKEFLDRTVDHILYMSDMKIETFDGNYSKFKQIRSDRLLKLAREYENDRAQREHIQSYIDRFRYNASRAAQAQSRIKMLEKMPVISPPKTDPVIKFCFPSTSIRGIILELTNVRFSYHRQDRCNDVNSVVTHNEKVEKNNEVKSSAEHREKEQDAIFSRKDINNCSNRGCRDMADDANGPTKNSSNKSTSALNIGAETAAGYKTIFTDLSLRITHNSRIVIVGDNGQGKSTLLKLLAHSINPDGGVVDRSPSLRIGYFAQHHVDHLDHNEYVLSHVIRICKEINSLNSDQNGGGEEGARAVLSRFGLNVGNQLIGILSGGQKSRLAFAVMSLSKPNLLILDEPTNHLDMETIEALAEAVGGFDGAVVCVSHDLSFIRQAFKDVYICENGKLTWFRRTAVDYKESIKL